MSRVLGLKCMMLNNMKRNVPDSDQEIWYYRPRQALLHVPELHQQVIVPNNRIQNLIHHTNIVAERVLNRHTPLVLTDTVAQVHWGDLHPYVPHVLLIHLEGVSAPSRYSPRIIASTQWARRPPLHRT